MAKQKNYRPLVEYLINSNKDVVRLTFKEIEDILGFELAPSARTYRQNWSNNEHETLTQGWLPAGYESFDVSMSKQVAHFRKVGSPSDVSPKVRIVRTNNAATTRNKSIETRGNVILLNKPFLGGWLDNEGHIGHEIIDFLLDDNGNYYVYNNPWGACPANIWIDGTTRLERITAEKYIGKYMVLTSDTHNKAFDILYVIELKEKLHRGHTTQGEDEEFRNINCSQEIVDLIKKLDVKYNGKYLHEIFGYESLCLTFSGKKIYKATEPITVTGLDYNFQRNKGYIYDDDYPNDYAKVIGIIESSIADGKLEEFTPRNVNHEQINDINAKKTFLDLIAMQESEQVYTNILHSILSEPGMINAFCNKFKENKIFDVNGTFKVFRETKVVDGRMDVCAESQNQRVIIENKVYSGLNGLKPADNKTQLSTYYDWGSEKSMKPLCFVVAPNFRVGEIKREIHDLDKRMEPIYLIKTYGDIADFIEEQYKNNKISSKYVYYSLMPQIINAFRNYSYSTKEDFYASKFLEASN